MAKNFVPLVGGGVQMPASAEAVAADITRLDNAVSELAEDVGALENWDAGDIPYDSTETYDDNTVGAGLNDLKSTIGENGANILAAYPTDNASGAVASFSDGAAVPVKNLVVNIEPVQSGSGDPSPDNVRPISGWSEAKVTRTGKNLLTAAPPWGTSAAMVVDLGKDVSVDSVVIQFKANNTSAASTNAALIDLRESDGTHHYSTLNGYKRDDGTYFNQQNTPFSGVFSTRHQNIKFRYVYTWYTGSAYSTFAADTITDWQITIADAVSDYEAPAKQTITIDLDGTIYGGTLDVLTGVLTVDKVAVTIDGDTLKANEIYSFSPNARTKTNYPTGLTGKYNSTSTFCLSDKLKPNYSQAIGNPANATELCVYPHSSGIMVTFPASTGVTTKALADAWFAENTPMVCYELSTPQTVQLTANEVSTLLGNNNVWADTGDTSVTYRADPSLYVDKKVSAAEQVMELIITANREDSMTATKAYVSGDLIIVGGKLYKATASIANGATLTVGTNVSQTTVAAEIAAVNS